MLNIFSILKFISAMINVVLLVAIGTSTWTKENAAFAMFLEFFFVLNIIGVMS